MSGLTVFICGLFFGYSGCLLVTAFIGDLAQRKEQRK
jgi:hypothetical protein